MNGVRGLVIQSTIDGNPVILGSKEFPLNLSYGNLGWLADSEHLFIQGGNNDNHIFEEPKSVPTTYTFQLNGTNFKQIEEKYLKPPKKVEPGWVYGDSSLLAIQKSGENVLVTNAYNQKLKTHSIPIPTIFHWSPAKGSYTEISLNVDSYPYNCFMDPNYSDKILCDYGEKHIIFKTFNSKEDKTFDVATPPLPNRNQVANFSIIGFMDPFK